MHYSQFFNHINNNDWHWSSYINQPLNNVVIQLDQQFWFMLILFRLGIIDAIVIAWFKCNTSFLFHLANFIGLSKYSNSLGIMRMVSMGLKDIFSFIKWEMIFDLMLLLVSIPSYMLKPSFKLQGFHFQDWVLHQLARS